MDPQAHKKHSTIRILKQVSFLFLYFCTSLAFQAPPSKMPTQPNSSSPFPKHLQCLGSCDILITCFLVCFTCVGLKPHQLGLKLQRERSFLSSCYLCLYRLCPCFNYVFNCLLSYPDLSIPRERTLCIIHSTFWFDAWHPIGCR